MAWSNSHRPLPHSEINLRERSQRTAADLVWRARTALTHTEAAGMLQGTSSPRHALLSLCAKHALTPGVHTRGSLVGSVQEEHRWRKWKENMAEMKTLMAQTTSRLWSPLAAECFGKLWKADFGFEAYALYSYSNPQIKTLAAEPLAGKSALCKAHECTILCKQKRLQLIAWGR